MIKGLCSYRSIGAISFCFLISYSAFCQTKEPDDLPNWLKVIVNKYSAPKSNNVQISEYKFRNQNVFVVDRTQSCCDLGATMYSEAGKELCQFVGYANAWEDSCKDFPANKKLIRVIYKRCDHYKGAFCGENLP